jgi:hypothetical protein
MGASKRHQTSDRRRIASLNVASKKKPSLREAKRIYSWCCGQYIMGCKISAYFIDLLSQVSKEAGSGVTIGIVGQLDYVGESAGVCFFGKGGHRLESIVAEAVT